MSKDGNKNMSKWFKVSFFIILLIGTGYFFGTICKKMYEAYNLILTPSVKQLIQLLLWFLSALFALMVSSGLIAALVRPTWVGIIAFALSGLLMLIGWKVSISSFILVLVYFLIAIFYTVSIDRELKQRIKFSVHPISEGQALLSMVLILIACGSLYFGYSAHIKEEGFSIPEFYIEKLLEQMEKRMIGEQLPVFQRRLAIAKLREEFQNLINDLTERMKSYEKFIPIAISLSLFMPLVTITRLLFWIPTGILSIIFPMLKAMGITKILSETKEVQRLTIS